MQISFYVGFEVCPPIYPGITFKTPSSSKKTASIGDFKLQWFEEVSDCHFMESYLHFIFKEFHYKKEFFKIDLDLAIEIAKVSTLYFEELENKLKDLFLGKVEFIEKRIKINSEYLINC